MSRARIICFFRLEEYIQIFDLTPEEEKEYRKKIDLDINEVYYFAEKILERYGVYTQDPQLTYIVMKGDLPVLNSKGELTTN